MIVILEQDFKHFLENKEFMIFRQLIIEDWGVTLSFARDPPFAESFANTNPCANLDTSI